METLPIDLQIALTRGYDDIPLFAEVLLGMELHEGQKRFFRDADGKINVLVPGNRYGKSVEAAIKHIHHCFYKVGIGRGNAQAWERASYMTANLAPHSELTMPVFNAIKQIMTSSFPIPQEGGLLKNNECMIGWFFDEQHVRSSAPAVLPFINNSQVLFRSTGEDKGDSIQGKSFGYISYDEGGRSNHLEYELNSNIIPRLADLNGKLDLISTPDMKSGSILYHFDLFEKGMRHEPGYYAQEGSVRENHFLLRNNPTYVQDMEQMYAGDPLLAQVLDGKFVFAGDNIFPGPDILDAKDDSLNSAMPYEEGHSYVIGVDTAMGEDEMVFTVIDVTKIPYRVVRMVACKGNSKSPQVHMADFQGLVEAYRRLNNVKIILETWNGESARFYQDMDYKYQVITKCFGSWQPQGIKLVGRNPKNVKKAEILLALRKLLAQHTLKIPNDSVLIKQLSIYREDDKNLPTDRVISLALACWLATDGRPKNPHIIFNSVTW